MKQKVFTPAAKGIVIALILIVFGLAIYFSGRMENKGMGAIQYIILLVGVIVSCIIYAKQMNGNVTFGNVFAHGFKTTTVVTVLICLYTIISMKFIFPGVLEKGFEEVRKNMEQQGNLSKEQIEQNLATGKKFAVPLALAGTLLFFGITGAIASAIGAGLSRKSSPSSFNQQPL